MTTLKGEPADPARTLAAADALIGAMDDRLAAIRLERANLDREELEVLERREAAMRAQAEVERGMPE